MRINSGATELLDYFQVIVHRRKTIVLVTSVTIALAILVALVLPKKYTSTTLILPPQQDQSLMGLMMGQVGGMTSIPSSLLGISTPADKYASILKSEAIKDQIINRFKLMDVYNKDYRLDMYDKLDKLVDINAGKKDGIISIAVEDEEPKRAADIANAYVEELEKLTVNLTIYGSGRNRSFLEGRLSKAKVDLAKAEEALKEFQSKSKAFQVPDQAMATIAGIAQLKAQLAVQEVQLSTLRRSLTDSSQEVKNTLSSISNLRSQIARLENGTGSGAMPALGSVPGLGQESMRLIREYKIQEALVELLTKQYELAKFTEAKDVSTLQVIQKARVPDKKTKPKRILIVLGAALLSFFGSILWILFKDQLEKLPEEDLRRWRELKLVLIPNKGNK